MRLRFSNLFRAMVLLILALHVFVMYCTARGDTYGFRLPFVALAAFFSLLMLIPLVWAVTLPELPEIYTQHFRPTRRWRRRQCPTCGYALRDLTGPTCPECGSIAEEPARYTVTWRTVRRFLFINLGAWVLGCVIAETWLQLDEMRFRAEVRLYIQCTDKLPLSRERLWPCGNDTLMYYSSPTGSGGTGVFLVRD